MSEQPWSRVDDLRSNLRSAAADLRAYVTVPVREDVEPMVSAESARAAVETIQRELLQQPWIKAAYPTLTISGVIDAATRSALDEFQQRAAQLTQRPTAYISAACLPTGLSSEEATAYISAARDSLSLPEPWTDPWPTAVTTAAMPRAQRQLGNTGKALITLLGGLITVLTMITGLGFLSETARDVTAVIVAALTAIAVFYSGAKDTQHADTSTTQ